VQKGGCKGRREMKHKGNKKKCKSEKEKEGKTEV
jgi:hypothetical protein